MAPGSLDGLDNQGEEKEEDDHEDEVEEDMHEEGKRMGMDNKAVDVVELEMLLADEVEGGHDVGSIVVADRAMRKDRGEDGV